jgi:hypothetical protein
MKNLFYLLFVLPLIFGCDDENDNNGSQNSDYWMFEVTINGVTHKAEGYEVFPNTGQSYNFAFASFSDEQVGLVLQDPSASTYVSGNTGNLYLTIEDNISTGVLNCCTMSEWIMDAAEESNAYWSWGYALTAGGTPEENSACGLGPMIPITITDLGTSGNGNYMGGTSFKGAYSGTIYLPSDTQNVTNFEYTIPMSIDIQFEALRP